MRPHSSGSATHYKVNVLPSVNTELIPLNNLLWIKSNLQKPRTSARRVQLPSSSATSCPSAPFLSTAQQ